MSNNDLSSPLSKAKGLGAAGNGSGVWWAQRVSAVALIPLVLWFAFFMLEAVALRDSDRIYSIFTSPFPTLFLVLFLGMGLYHGCLGMKEIIEDYVHNHAVKVTLIIFIQFFTLVTAVSGISALLVFHLSTFIFN